MTAGQVMTVSLSRSSGQRFRQPNNRRAQVSIHEFPPDLFSQTQRGHGAITVHALVVIYMFAALAIVCDDYFVPSLEKISEELDEEVLPSGRGCTRNRSAPHQRCCGKGCGRFPRNLGLSDDVAGATFMAAGSSAPELFTSIIGVFIAKGDVGLGTIVGSAVFNILFVIGLCGLFAGIIVPLTWWPLFRDTAAYLVSIITLIFVIEDGIVTCNYCKIVSFPLHRYESLVMLLEYTAYIFFMGFNPQVVGWLQRRKMRKQGNAVQHTEDTNKRNSILMSERSASDSKTPSPTHKPLMVDEIIQQSPRKLNFHDAGFRVMMTHHFKPETRLRAAARVLVLEMQEQARVQKLREQKCQRQLQLQQQQQTLQYQGQNQHDSQQTLEVLDGLMSGGTSSAVSRSQSTKSSIGGDVPEVVVTTTYGLDPPGGIPNGLAPQTPITTHDSDSATQSLADGDLHSDELEPGGICEIPDDLSGKFRWAVMLPCSLILCITCPDVRKRRWEKWFIVTFMMSIFWIFIFSYIMVFMATIIAYTLGIPDTITGITLLAAGTSVPDAMASLIVARQGLGDMAVSNSIGSNVFDILLGLGLPWFLKTTIVSWGGSVAINSRGMIYSVGLLFGTVVLMILGIHCNKWRLTRPLGISAMFTYLVFLVFAVCIECNVFVYVNPPLCPE
ncbi:SLC24A3 [Branchiostoma lanceolatum]|uniref:SLC24A3 protein n=1 Tax=Branchiostoma lanceolatum TaxID=7740 RepID=A0A8J9ZQI9_BRALA|nr:SLC24A3 [Branchiostoma lanceolatum]